MNEETIDDSQQINFSSNPFIWIGVGVFFWLSIVGFGYVFKEIIKDILIIINVNPEITFWASHIGKLLILLVFTLIALNKIKLKISQSKQPDLFLFKRVIIAFIVSQGIQFFYTYYIHQLLPDEYYKNSLLYFELFHDLGILRALGETAFSVLLYVIVAILLYKMKPIDNSSK